ncbi:hypothetical protein PGT21_014976 [Puccinia graminis f. sp. tritici]|uniref:Uncharacterized protein n=1 Tax=Puccinia graminis f. sp. tritici TaxID=56615 RepID=A0A5B0MB99_PUCGR|nr:hypothetical protein PGT21_014976 [Puccinia graminis f. sp. tritici]
MLQVAAAPEVVSIKCWQCHKRTTVHERCQTELACGHICNFIKSTNCDDCKHNIPTGHDHARPAKCPSCGTRGNASTANASPSVSRSSSSRSSASSASGYSVKRYTDGR